MSSVTHPRGPLPARVYWTRRLLVTVVALAVVFGVARLVGGGGGSDPSARTVVDAASSSPTPSATPTPTATTPSTAATVTPTATASGAASATAGAALAEPTGTCAASDVVATPTVKDHAYAGRPVVFAVDLTTRQSEACTWTVSAHSLVLKVSSGSDAVWSTQQCTGAVPKQSVVVRRDEPTSVDLAWTGQRSDSDCSRTTAWAEPGTYHAVAATFGGDPTDLRFTLLSPPRPTVTKTPKPHASERAAARRSATSSPTPTATTSHRPTAHASAHASASPSPSRR